MFGSEDTRAVIHTGSLAVIVLGICGAVSGLRATFPRLAVSIVLIRILFALALYVPAYHGSDLTPYRDYSISRAVIAAGCLLAFAIMAFGSRSFRLANREEELLTNLRQERDAPSPQAV